MADSAFELNPNTRLVALRIIDANFNRATEGLRVVEEYCRFALGDGLLTGFAKDLRHQVLEAIQQLPREQFVVARDTEHDVGTNLANCQSVSRFSLDEIVRANLQRVEQALRAIEEYAKLFDAAAAVRIEKLRYHSYTLAKACLTTAASQERLAAARLYVLIDSHSSESRFAERAHELIAAGVHILQLRDKDCADRTLLARARLLRRIIDESVPVQPDLRIKDPPASTLDVRPPLLILNDRPDLAVLACADGVHLGQQELTVHEARRIVGPEMLIGISTHSLEQARQAVLDGANYLGCGPTFPSATKQFDHFPGLSFLRGIASEISLPAFAIGGITLENLPEVLATGFTRVAVSGAIAARPDAADQVRSFLTALPPVSPYKLRHD